MNVISRSHESIPTLLAGNARLATGLDFLNLIRESSVVERFTGLSPMIVGGAVRDVLFEGNNPNDIDIFFYRNDSVPTTQRIINQQLQNAREDLLLWLEDQDIAYESLLSDAAANYFGGNRFLDILSFEWRGVNIQVMIPQNYLNLASNQRSLLKDMPLSAGAGITLENIVFLDTFLCCNEMRHNNIYPAPRNMDVQYYRRKRPNGRILRIANVDSLVYSSLGVKHLNSVSLGTEQITVLEAAPVFNRRYLIEKEINSLFPNLFGNFTMEVADNSLRETL